MAGPEVTLTFVGDAKKLKNAFGDAERGAQTFGDRMKKANRAAVVGSTAVLAAAAGMGKQFLDAGREGVKVEKQLDQVFRSMGGTGSSTFKVIGEQAEQLGERLGVSTTEVQKVQTKLATFGKVWEDQRTGPLKFHAATELAFDLEAAGFGDAESNITQLGKAINDPIKGMTALTRSGVSFTKQEQEKIKKLQESGDLLGAQEMIYGALSEQVGETAASGVDAGDRMSASWENFQDKMGRLLIPVMNTVAGLMSDLVGWASQNEEAVIAVTLGVVGLAAAILTINGLIKVWKALTAAVTAAQWLLNTALKMSPFWRIVTVLGLIGGAMVALWNKSKTFRDIVKGVFRAVAGAVGWVIRQVEGLINAIVDAIAWVDRLANNRKVGQATGGASIGRSVLNLPGRAHGGPVAAGRPYRVGELGEELFVPNTSGRIIPNDELGGGGGVAAVALTVSVAPGADSAFATFLYGQIRKGNIRLTAGGQPVRVT